MGFTWWVDGELVAAADATLPVADHGLTVGDGCFKTTSIVRGAGCNWMVCLAIWLQMIATEPISKFIMIWLPIELFISSGFDHLVVNEFLIPGGIIVGGKFLDSRINWGNAFWFNFIPVTIGSIVGAWFLVIPFWFVNKDGFWKRQEREAAAKAAKEEKVVEA